MGSVNMKTTLAYWYSHDSEEAQASMKKFAQAVESTNVPFQNDTFLYCFVAPRELINSYYVAAWLPSGSKSGWEADRIHEELGDKFRSAALDTGAHVMVAWDFDLGQAHGHEMWLPGDSYENTDARRIECNEQYCANFHGWRPDMEGKNSALYKGLMDVWVKCRDGASFEEIREIASRAMKAG